METPGASELRHPIRVVARRTGLSPSVLRAWERRYAAVEPDRSEGGQRLYSDADIHRLGLMKRLVDGGRTISRIANLPAEELHELVRRDALSESEGRPPASAVAGPAPVPDAGEDARTLLERAFRAVEAMDRESLDRTLVRAAVILQPWTLIAELVLPLLSRIGDRWEHGHLGPAAEHLASGVVRGFLQWLIATAQVEPGAPLLLTATPRGQLHEFGALLSGAVASGLGWRTVFVGADLPAEELSLAVGHMGATAIALSAIHPNGPVSVVKELAALRALLPSEVLLLAGGPAVRAHRTGLTASGVIYCETLADLAEKLREAGPSAG
jgi:MerR family transcriptional regulator, light-induced transcriptional regulator